MRQTIIHLLLIIKIIFIKDANFTKTSDLQKGPLRLKQLTKIIFLRDKKLKKIEVHQQGKSERIKNLQLLYYILHNYEI